MKCSDLVARISSIALALATPAVSSAGRLPDVTLPWGSDFAAATNRAVEGNLPLVLLVGATGCDFCNHLKASLLNSDEFLDWKAGAAYEFCCVEHTGTATTPAFDFALTANESWPPRTHKPMGAG